MIDVIWATPLYEFLRQCNTSPLEKTILDCGAGSSTPPLPLFNQYGHRTYGVEIAQEGLAKAQQFCQEQEMSLKNEWFAKHEDDEADSCFRHFDILCKANTLIDKAHGSGRLKQAYIEYIARQR